MLLHVRTNAVGIAEETQVAKLIDLVRPDALLAQELLVPGKVFRRATEEAHTGAGESDLGRRREHERTVGVSGLRCHRENVVGRRSLADKRMYGVRVVPVQAEVGAAVGIDASVRTISSEYTAPVGFA